MRARHYLLFPLVMPGIGENEETYQYIRKYEINELLESTAEELTVYNFDTWFNLFPFGLYRRYCDLGNIYFHARVEGEYRIKIFGYQQVEEFRYQHQLLYSSLLKGNFCWNMPSYEDKYEAFFIEFFFKSDNYIKIKSLGWHTDKKPLHKTRLHLININDEIKIVSRVAKYSYLAKDIMEYTSPVKSETAHGRYEQFPTEVLSEFLHAKPKNTEATDRLLIPAQPIHIAFITLARLLILTGYLKDVYRNIFIYGEYLNPLNNILCKRVMTLDNSSFRNPFYFYDLHDTSQILNIINENKHFVQNHELRYCPEFAWLCLSADTLRARGLPLRMDFKSSIYEYVCRAGTPRFLTINGFNPVSVALLSDCLISRDFEDRLKMLFLLNLAYNDTLDEFLKNLVWRKNLLHLTWNYAAMEKLIKTVSEISRGDFDNMLDGTGTALIEGAQPASEADIQKALGHAPQPPEKADPAHGIVFADRDLPESFYGLKKVEIIYPFLNIKESRIFDEKRGKELDKNFRAALEILKESIDDLKNSLPEYYARIIGARGRQE